MTDFPPPPETLRDRIALAVAAHDIRGGEGRLEDDELAAVEFALRNMPSWKAFGPVGPAHQRALRRLLVLERGFRETEGKALMYAHLIALDWPSYRGAADAALSVMLERPEAVSQIVGARLPAAKGE